jgi:hypothetical protein
MKDVINVNNSVDRFNNYSFYYLKFIIYLPNYSNNLSKIISMIYLQIGLEQDIVIILLWYFCD